MPHGAWVRVVAIWSLASVVWIMVTDILLDRWGGLPVWGQTLKGWFFVVATTVFVAVLLTRAANREAALRSRLMESQKHEALARLAHEVAHDFNNLLTAIIGFASLARDHLREDDPARDSLAQVLEAADRSAGLTRQLLDFGQRTASEASTASTELCQVVRELEILIRSLLGPRIRYTIQIEEVADVRVSMARGRLEQIVMNLVVNARDAMPEGGELKLRCGRRSFRGPDRDNRLGLAPGDYGLLVIEDSGSGIATDDLPKIFEPFFTTKATGTGLGLATCHSIVHQHGGSIRVESRPDQGTRFDILLPCDATPAGSEASPSASETSMTRGLVGRPTVVLAEDDPHLRRMARVTLAEAGATVLDAADGLEAVQLIQSADRLDLLVTDLALPKLGGALVAQAVAGRQPEVPVLFISALPTDPSDLPGRFLAKPFTPSRLLSEVQIALGEAGAGGGEAGSEP